MQVEQQNGGDDSTNKLGWCLKDVQTNEWWCVTEVISEGTIKAINERGRSWKVAPLVFVRTNGDKRGHAGKMEAARFAKASMDRRGHWAVPRNERNSGNNRLELVMVPVRTGDNDIVKMANQDQKRVVDAIVVEKYVPLKKRGDGFNTGLSYNNENELRLNESAMMSIVLC